MKRTNPIIITLGLFLFAQVVLAQWMPAKRLTWNAGTSSSPAIAVDPSDNLHVVWSDDTPGNYEINYKKSTNGGSTWMPSQRLTWNSVDSAYPSIAVDSFGSLHVVWSDKMPGNYEIYYKKSTNGGSTWTANKRLTSNSGTSYSQAIAVDPSDNLHVVWSDDTSGNYEIYYKKSTNGGSMWTANKRLTWTSGASCSPAIGVDSAGNLHMVLFDYTPGTAEIYYRQSTDEGSTWMPRQRLTWNSVDSAYPSIAVDSSDSLHVVWFENLEIYYKKSTDGGSTWMATKWITRAFSYSFRPTIAADSAGNAHVAWQNGDSPTNFEIYYRKSTNGGSTWLTNQRLSWNSGGSKDPLIAVDSSSNLHVVWGDDTPGNYEIYYKKYVKE